MELTQIPSLATQSETAGASYSKCVIQKEVHGKRRRLIPKSNSTPRRGNIAKWRVKRWKKSCGTREVAL